MTRKPWLCRLGLHAWRTPSSHRHSFDLYEECERCGKRRVTLNRFPGYAPIDGRWLAGGEPSGPPLSIPHPGPTVMPPR